MFKTSQTELKRKVDKAVTAHDFVSARCVILSMNLSSTLDVFLNADYPKEVREYALSLLKGQQELFKTRAANDPSPTSRIELLKLIPDAEFREKRLLEDKSPLVKKFLIGELSNRDLLRKLSTSDKEDAHVREAASRRFMQLL
ncbi:MAG: hypothetical protein ABR981_03975 [Candidatus Micrarchaeaceae archaeon]|jgi:hypothetical protein